MTKIANYAIKPLVPCQEHILELLVLGYPEISRHWVSDASIEKAKQKGVVPCISE